MVHVILFDFAAQKCSGIKPFKMEDERKGMDNFPWIHFSRKL